MIYRIWHGTDNDRSEIARAKANSIDQVIELVKKEFLKPDTLFDEDGDDQSLYLMIDVCQDCDSLHNRDCEYCERSEYIEIEEDQYGIEPEFKLMTGSNEFYDLTGGKTEKAEDWNHTLKVISETDRQQGLKLATRLVLSQIADETADPQIKARALQSIENLREKK